MKNTHTPGPWLHDDGHIFIEAKDRKYNSIATIHEIYTNDGAPEVNVHLIRNAPELLEALELAYNLLEEHQGEARWYLREHYNKIKTALNKAKGIQ